MENILSEMEATLGASALSRNLTSLRLPIVTGTEPATSTAIQVLDILNTLYMPLVIYMGLVGNILSFVTFFFTHLKSRTSSLYMGSLAISDSGYLCVLSFVWLNERGINVYQQGWCQLLVFLSSAFGCWSVWLTVSFTAERFVAVRYPLWRLQMASKLRPKVTIMLTALFSFAFNSYLLLFVGVNDTDHGSPECSLNSDYENALYYINILDTIITLIVPFVLITVMNFMIARAIYLFYARYKQQRNICRPGHSSKDSLDASPTKPDVSNSSSTVAHATQISVTRMLLLVSTVFILLNLPSYVIRIYVFVLSLSDSITGSEPYVLQRYFMLLYYTNFAINFVLYNASSRMFRVTLCDYVQNRWSAIRDTLGTWKSNLTHSSTSQNEDIII
ncbi:thyrotropin-releasing hormone receptor-like [Ornithodoros turicata]|uniref:thyrotropin-releasing hormone receptor-like n=1 Tax=Ornithodoros turicata TaxID=34597 RepID=UPI0031397C82